MLFSVLHATDTVLVRGIIANKKDQGGGDFDLIPGQYAPVPLILGQDPAALLIPQPALVESQIGKQVFVVNADNNVESRSVEVGRGYQGQSVNKKCRWICNPGSSGRPRSVLSKTWRCLPARFFKIIKKISIDLPAAELVNER